MGRNSALLEATAAKSDPESSASLKRLDLTGRERRLRAAMQALSRIATQFARSARRTLPFLVKRRTRLAPGPVAFVDLSADQHVSAGPVYEVLLEAADSPAWACLFINADALGIVLEGALGGAGDGASASLGSDLTVAQSALVSKVIRQIAEDLAQAVKKEVGVELQIRLAHSIATGDEREASYGDGLGVDCVFEGLESPAKVSLSMGADALESALKDRDSEAPPLGDPRMAQALFEVPVEVVAELGRLTLGLRRVLTMQPGQVLRLSTAVDDAAILRIGGVAKFSASPVISRGQLAVQIKARHED